MKTPIKFPLLMMDKTNSFTNQLTNYVVVYNLKQFFWSKKLFNCPVYTYDQSLLTQALNHE